MPRAVTDAWQSIKVRSFEYVSASPSTSLLRLSGKPARRQSSSQRPKLRLESARQTYHYAALPAPADPRGTLRAAYSVPSSLIETDSKFWLEHTDGSITELPYPTPGESRGAPTQDVHPAPTPRSGDPAAEQPEPHSDLHATLAAQSSELAEAQRAAAGNDQARRRAE